VHPLGFRCAFVYLHLLGHHELVVERHVALGNLFVRALLEGVLEAASKDTWIRTSLRGCVKDAQRVFLLLMPESHPCSAELALASKRPVLKLFCFGSIKQGLPILAGLVADNARLSYEMSRHFVLLVSVLMSLKSIECRQ